MSIKLMNSIGTFAGGCNVQFAINPETEEIIAIENSTSFSRIRGEFSPTSKDLVQAIRARGQA
jgi:hypothetical protein